MQFALRQYDKAVRLLTDDLSKVQPFDELQGSPPCSPFRLPYIYCEICATTAQLNTEQLYSWFISVYTENPQYLNFAFLFGFSAVGSLGITLN